MDIDGERAKEYFNLAAEGADGDGSGSESASQGSGESDSPDYCVSCGNVTYYFADTCPVQGGDVEKEWDEFKQHVEETYEDATVFDGLDFFTLYETWKLGYI